LKAYDIESLILDFRELLFDARQDHIDPIGPVLKNDQPVSING
jgi:hypothetical protein